MFVSKILNIANFFLFIFLFYVLSVGVFVNLYLVLFIIVVIIIIIHDCPPAFSSSAPVIIEFVSV